MMDKLHLPQWPVIIWLGIAAGAVAFTVCVSCFFRSDGQTPDQRSREISPRMLVMIFVGFFCFITALFWQKG